MPAFAINVIDRAGVRRFLREDAPSEATLRVHLRAQSLWPVRIREVPADRKLARLVLPAPEFIGLLHQLELQLRAGVNADTALGQLAADAPPGAMRLMLEKIHREVAQGTPIHVACRFFERQFPPHLAAVVSAGEASAQLPAAIRALAAHVGNNAELRRTARRALIYPVVVLIATTALVGFLLGGVVPQFAAIFASLHLTLPAVTVALIAASDFVRHGWPAVVALLVGAVGVAGAVARSPRVRHTRDAVLLRLPLLGDVIRHLATARFAAHCRLLHEAGIPLLEALKTGAELTGNAVMARQLLAARERVAEGQPLYAALPKKHAFPGFIVPALKSGETTGQLGAALRHIEDYAASRAREQLATALALLEPALLATLTGIVGLIASLSVSAGTTTPAASSLARMCCSIACWRAATADSRPCSLLESVSGAFWNSSSIFSRGSVALRPVLFNSSMLLMDFLGNSGGWPVPVKGDLASWRAAPNRYNDRSYRYTSHHACKHSLPTSGRFDYCFLRGANGLRPHRRHQRQAQRDST